MKNDLILLYIEDDKGLRDQYKEFFQRKVGTLHTASNGLEGLDKFNEINPDIIITDIKMPVMNGIEMIKKIREINTDIPIIVTSAFNDQEFLLEAINEGVTRYLIKPFNRNFLRKLIDETVEYTLLKKKDFEEQKKIKKMLNLQKSIVTIISSGEVEFANDFFFKLSGYKDLVEFKEHHPCLCTLFVENKKESYLKPGDFGRQMNNNCLESIDEKKVKIYFPKTGIYKNFIVSIDNFEEKGNKFLATFTDITKLEELEEENKKQKEMIFRQTKISAMGEILNNIAHHWRQPLSIITSVTSNLKFIYEIQGSLPTQKVLKCAEDVESQAFYLSEVINEFKNYFLNSDPIIKTINMNKKLGEMILLTQIPFEKHHIKTISRINKDLMINMDENLFTESLINIMNNSVEAFEKNNTPNEKRYFFIDAFKKKDTLVIKLKDSAGGIAENIIDKIFDPYFTTKHQAMGTGVGLYMTNQIITRQLKGDIEVQNIDFEYEGKSLKGVEFTISIIGRKR